MKKSVFILFLVASVFMLPAFGISHGATTPSGYSESLNVYVAGSSALWSLNFQGANSTQGISQIESQSGLTSYTLTALKTSNLISDFQIFFQDGYKLVNLPFIPDQGIFLTVNADSSATSDKVAALFNDYLKTSFAKVPSSSSLGGTTTTTTTIYFSPIDFTVMAAPPLFKLIPSGVSGFTSVLTPAQFLKMLGPMIVLSGVRGSSGFSRTVTLSAVSSSVLLAQKLQFQKVLGLTTGSINSSSVAGTSTVSVHVLDGFVASTDAAQVTNNAANLSGSYSLSAPLGHKISPNVTVVQNIPVISAVRALDRGSAQQGDTISVTLTLKNSAVGGTALNVVVNDTWWKAYPGLLQLSRGNTSFKLVSLQPGKDYTNTYVLSVNSTAKSEITIPPVAATFTYAVGTANFTGRSVFNQAQIRLNDVGPAISISVTSDRQSGSPLGLPTHFFVTVTNLGNGPALSLQVANQTRASLAQGGAAWTFNETLGYSSLAQRNLTRFWKLQWQTSSGKTEFLSSNEATLLLSHSNMLIPYFQTTANATVPQITGSVKAVNVSYDFKNKGTVNGTAAHGSLTLPSGLSCASQNLTSGSCQGNNVSVDFAQINTKTPSIVTTVLNVTKPDNYVVPAMEITTSYMNMTLHAWSSPVPLPVGLSVTKTFSPSSLFSRMTSKVLVAVSNLGSSPLYNATVTSPADSFDVISTTGGANSKSFSPLSPQGQYSFNYSVTTDQQASSGNSSVAPVIVNLIFAGHSHNLVFGQNAVQILRTPSLSVATNPPSPIEGNTFTATVTISNPSPVGVSAVHAVIPLPSSLDVINPPSRVRVAGQNLTVDLPTLAPRSTYAVNLTLRSSMGVVLDLTKAKLSFSYQGSNISGTIPNASLTVNEDVTSRYIEPIVLGLFVLILFVVIIRRRVSSSSSPAGVPPSSRKSAYQA